LLLVAFLLLNAPNCHLSLVLASVVQGDAVNCNSCLIRSLQGKMRNAIKRPIKHYTFVITKYILFSEDK